MFTRIWNWLVGIERHAVDTIVSDFHTIVDRLEASASHHFIAAAKAEDEANRLREVEYTARGEANRALAVASKVRDLVS